MTWLGRIVREPFRARTWRETAFLLLGVVTGAVAFTIIVAGVTTAAVLAVTILGLPIVFAIFVVFREIAGLDRQRAALVFGQRLPAVYRQPRDRRLLTRLWTASHDPQTWKDTLWLVLAGPIGLANSIAVVTTWGFVAYALSAPLWWWAVAPSAQPGFDHGRDGTGGVFVADDWPMAMAWFGLGVAALLLAPWIVRVLALGEASLQRLLLGPSKRALLRARVDELAATRSGAVDEQEAELRRIERDLHDGAQARLVAVAMDLGMAQEKLDSSPDEARLLVAAAHDEAKTALKELRDLVRGIHPAILTDRGLDAAVSSLASVCPVPVTVRVDAFERPRPAVESAAYFVVAESLTNIAKHSEATQAGVSIVRDGGSLVVEVTDDGVGGADTGAGSGLAGLERRVRALDGGLFVSSPAGGPTTVRAEIPCGS